MNPNPIGLGEGGSLDRDRHAYGWTTRRWRQILGWWMRSQAKEHQRSPASLQALGERHGTEPPSQPSEAVSHAHTLQMWDKAFLFCPEMPGLWHLIIAALGNEHDVFRKIPRTANTWSKVWISLVFLVPTANLQDFPNLMLILNSINSESIRFIIISP